MNEREVQEQVQKLRDALEQAKAKLLEQKEMLEQLTTPPLRVCDGGGGGSEEGGKNPFVHCYGERQH